MSAPFFAHHGIQYSAEKEDPKRISHESVFHKIWVTFLFGVLFLFLIIFL